MRVWILGDGKKYVIGRKTLIGVFTDSCEKCINGGNAELYRDGRKFRYTCRKHRPKGWKKAGLFYLYPDKANTFKL